LWVLSVLQTDEVSRMFFPPQRSRGRTVERDFWMTMDSVLSGAPEKEIAQRWNVPGRIGSTLSRCRPKGRSVLHDVGSEGAKRLVEWHRSSHVKNVKRDLQQRGRK